VDELEVDVMDDGSANRDSWERMIKGKEKEFEADLLEQAKAQGVRIVKNMYGDPVSSAFYVSGPREKLEIFMGWLAGDWALHTTGRSR
jgi:hypothetical protein